MQTPITPSSYATFESRLEPVGRILEDPNYNTWCCSPIRGEDGRIHVFYSRWPNEADHVGWLSVSEIAHAVADDPEGPYVTLGTVLAGRGDGHWDAHTIHNPTVHKVGGKYAMFYIGNRYPDVESQRTGVAIADSLDGPWERFNEPMIPGGLHPDDLDSAYACNPAMVQAPDGRFFLYYAGMSLTEWNHDLKLNGLEPGSADVGKKANRRTLLAIGENAAGPYLPHENNPVIDLGSFGDNAQCEDPYVWYEDGTFHLIGRDMGYFNHEYGLYFNSKDGITWSTPQIAYKEMHDYIDEEPNGLDREGRLERPQLLLDDNGQPTHLFGAFRGGKYNTSSGFVFRIKSKQ